MKVKEAQKEYQKDKRVGELLSSNLTSVKESFKLTETSKKDLLMSAEEAFEDYKKEYEESLNVIYPDVEPIGSDIITTASLMNIMDAAHNLLNANFDVNLIRNFKNTVSEYQTVVAIGPDTRQIKIGDKIRIRISDFKRIKNPNSVKSEEVFELPLIEIDKRSYLSFNERNAQYRILDNPS